MAVVLQSQNGETRLIWTVQANTAKINNVLDDSGEYWYKMYSELKILDSNGKAIEWSELSVAQKKTVFNKALIKLVKDAARISYVRKQDSTDHQTNVEEAEGRCEFNEPS